MKFTLITAAVILSTLASSLALPDLTPRATVIRPSIAIPIKQEFPNTAFPPTNIAEISIANGHQVQTLLGFVVSPCTGSCKISLSDVTASGSLTLQLFSLSRYPVYGDTWNNRPYTDNHKGTFQTSTTGSGPATVVEDFGLTFPCPVTIANLGFEIHPVGDEYHISWDIRTGGLIITCGQESLPLKVEAGELRI